MSIGKNIKKYRSVKGFTQKELAEKSNISRSYLADLERDRYNPSLDVLKLIANSLEVDLSELLGETKQPANELDFDLGTVKLNKIARYAKDLEEADQDVVLNVLEAMKKARKEKNGVDDDDGDRI